MTNFFKNLVKAKPKPTYTKKSDFEFVYVCDQCEAKRFSSKMPKEEVVCPECGHYSEEYQPHIGRQVYTYEQIEDFFEIGNLVKTEWEMI